MTDRFPQTVGNSETDVGLRSFMLGTYRYMAMAMLVSAAVAVVVGQYLITNPGLARTLFSPWVFLAFVIAIPVLFGTVGAKMHAMSKGGVVAFLFGFSAFMGLFLSVVTVSYSPVIIAKVFFMTVALFGALSLFGHTTQRDLGVYVKYAMIAFVVYVGINLLGAFVPALAPSGPLDLVITGVALLAISMITAWETQMLKRTYYGMAGNPAMLSKMSAFGAATLLLVFINMFQILLSLFGRD